MTITVEGIHDLATWASSKTCNGWRLSRLCLDRDTGKELTLPHPGCVQAQRAHDLLSSMERYEGEDVIGWLVSDEAVNPDSW